jgi:threonyl-tRNA synthetase
MLIVGDKEAESNSVSVRCRSGDQIPAQSLNAFIETLSADIASKV